MCHSTLFIDLNTRAMSDNNNNHNIKSLKSFSNDVDCIHQRLCISSEYIFRVNPETTYVWVWRSSCNSLGVRRRVLDVRCCCSCTLKKKIRAIVFVAGRQKKHLEGIFFMFSLLNLAANCNQQSEQQPPNMSKIPSHPSY